MYPFTLKPVTASLQELASIVYVKEVTFEFVKRVSALKAGDNTSITWMRDVTVSVERDESTKSPNAIVQCVNDAQTSSSKVTESCRRRRSHEVFHNTPSCDVGQECINL